ncbi:MAG: N-6 DNA methylase [Candidatus Bathyarchaeia archaeon]
MVSTDLIERSRLKIQENLDAAKARDARRKLGQFATPSPLATEILQYAHSFFSPHSKIRFLDPAFGTGVFYSTLLNVFSQTNIRKAVGFEIDENYWRAATELWNDDSLLDLQLCDFTHASPPNSEQERFNLIICNPPYVRHHGMTTCEKQRLMDMVTRTVGIRPSGYSGLYCYFLMLSHRWMTTNGLAGWLVPSEFMDVNYGRQVKEYLLNQVSLLRIHRFDPSERQFEDALVSSAVVWIEKKTPPPDHAVEFTYGGTLLRPATSERISAKRLKQLSKWSRLTIISCKEPIEQASIRLEDFFSVKRGIATGANSFFVLNRERATKLRIPPEFLIPVLPPPRHLNIDEVEADLEGNPILDQKLFLLSCKLPEEIVRTNYRTLWNYLQSGVEQKVNERYICRHRSPWYSQEKRPPASLLFNIMGRPEGAKRRPYRFILNKSLATATNVYLMLYPKPNLKEMIERDPDLLECVWRTLNDIPLSELLREGRVYGGGLYKLEPNELGHVASDELIHLLSTSQKSDRKEWPFK